MKHSVFCPVVLQNQIFKNSAGVRIAGFFTPDSKKSLSPVSSMSAFASMVAYKMGRLLMSRICVSLIFSSVGIGTNSKESRATERNLSRDVSRFGNFLLNIRLYSAHKSSRDWDRRRLLHTLEKKCRAHLMQQK